MQYKILAVSMPARKRNRTFAKVIGMWRYGKDWKKNIFIANFRQKKKTKAEKSNWKQWKRIVGILVKRDHQITLEIKELQKK